LKEPLRRDPQRAATLITGFTANASISLFASVFWFLSTFKGLLAAVQTFVDVERERKR